MENNLMVNLVQDGTTSVALDADLLASAAGLTLATTDGTVESIPEDFGVGFDITEESTLVVDQSIGAPVPVGEDPSDGTPLFGEIDHTGTVTFTSTVGEITVGDFAIGFDAARQTENASGFFVENTVEGVLPDGAILFDVSNPESLEIADTGISLGSADLLVSSEFASVLVATDLATDNLTGADVGDAAIQGIFGSDLF